MEELSDSVMKLEVAGSGGFSWIRRVSALEGRLARSL